MPNFFTMKNVVSAGILSLTTALLPVDVSAETLGDALASSYKTSGLLEQNRANLRATDEGVATALSSLRPTISYTASSDYDFASNAWTEALTFSASMAVYTFGRNQLNVDAAKETVLATRASLVNVEQGVLSDAVDAYMNSRLVSAQVELRENSLRVMQSNLRAAQDRFEVGEITRTDLAQFEAEVASGQALLASAKGLVSAGRETYKVAIGHYPNNLSTPPSVKLPAKDADEAVRIAMRRHPALKALQHQIAALDLAVTIAERGLLPTVSVGASTTRVDGFEAGSESFGVSASGTIYAGGALTSSIRRAMADRDASRASLITLSREVEQGVRTAWAMLSVFDAAARATAASVEAQRVAYQGVREEAELGASTTLDVLEAEEDLLDAQVTALEARIDRETSSYTLLAAMGLLTVEHLNINVSVYDPAAYYNAVKNGPTHTVSPEGAKLDRVLEIFGRQ